MTDQQSTLMKPKQGSRKVVLTQWMLVIFSLVTAGYMVLNGYQGNQLPESFFMTFVTGLGFIGGAFTAGNIFEHRAKATIETQKQGGPAGEKPTAGGE